MGDYDCWQEVPPEGGEVGMGGSILGATKVGSDLQLRGQRPWYN